MAKCRAGQGGVPQLCPFPSFPLHHHQTCNTLPLHGDNPALTILFRGDWNTPQQDISASELAALPFPQVKLHRTSLPDQVQKLLGHPREPRPWRSTWLMPHDTLPSSARLTPPDLRRKGFDALLQLPPC